MLRGKNIEGASAASLSKAFIQSGCRATVSSFWEVPDQSTMKVMELFYTYLKEGMSKATAMRQAQLTYLNDGTISTPRSRTPVHWASWAVYGDDAPVTVNGKSWRFYGLVLLVGIVGALFIFFDKKNSIMKKSQS